MSVNLFSVVLCLPIGHLHKYIQALQKEKHKIFFKDKIVLEYSRTCWLKTKLDNFSAYRKFMETRKLMSPNSEINKFQFPRIKNINRLPA